MGSSQSTPQQDTNKLSQCPIQHQNNNPLQSSTNFNESNNIPELPQAPSPGQRTKLSLQRTLSSIPRPSSPAFSAEEEDNTEVKALGNSSCPVHQSTPKKEKDTWVYPSPQQFYNALVRKGWETPEESIPIMVDIHNWMNEAVWNEVLRWESRYFFTPSSSSSSSSNNHPVQQQEEQQPEISLVKFQGRPHELSPKARFNILLSMIFPNLYNPVRPFDRHDWSICREHLLKQDPQVEKSKLCRYVIDYYNGGIDEDGNPVFHFDVRPAIDDLDSLVVRVKEWARIKNETWFKTPDQSTKTHPNIVQGDSKI
ncbi:holocytochrome c synthase [Puccinia graminis f. sp. tritici]|uniref:Holocytochrome c-type synthase n=1 Tax=Puccinia graminis f. sp. tritici TaxID=56615 RepID=A0A5B0R5F4_PUCGR|nr:holocytochrome c synthase [Puccinia graminis f. sp. tritici]KAA1120609.1 holocytochrome c synthase [Puccinia graminis f. sp. tritici]